jgi:hypothetical protein
MPPAVMAYPVWLATTVPVVRMVKITREPNNAALCPGGRSLSVAMVAVEP